MNWDKRHLTGNWEGAPSLHGFLLQEERSSFLQESDYKAIPSKLEQSFASCFSDTNAVRGLELFQSNKQRKKRLQTFPAILARILYANIQSSI